MAPDFLRFASINIEGDKHLSAVVSFLKSFQPDVVCFEELNEPTLPFFEKTLGMNGYFVAMSRDLRPQTRVYKPGTPYGIGFFSSLTVSGVHSEYYYGGAGELPTLQIGDETTVWRPLLSGIVEKNGAAYRIAVTHFTRTPNGGASDKQRTDMHALMGLLERMPEFVLCGDFNAPRSGEIFSMLAEKYQDNIPREYTSSLDPKIHKLQDSKQLMVDGLFTTASYQASEVKLTEGISDHKAVTALISKRS